ncbi:MAG TPA: hypothetical protein VJ227_01930 [Patescibacteria group bacterium]|nr:hypothetical protein [Patescibacteria group bacterium]
MAVSPEIEKVQPEIKEVPMVPEIPPEIERSTGVKVVQKTFTAQVKGDKGQSLIQPVPTQVINVTPPADDKTLSSWAKGPIVSSLSWLGMFWIRILKRAMHFGWKITGKQ